ncbi:MAG: 1-acyl-sn-glycerol-3-phosphate acyltransferase [Rhizobiales bacterium]|nr:1-acyl-sn-glycerol-3-phosphate acyltransferase [Hyphomicrobiales bacterium]
MAARMRLFTVLVYPAFFLWMLIGSPFLLLPRRALIRMMSVWGKVFIGFCRVFAGLKLEIRGREHLPEGPVLIAAKHQSAWETLALLGLFDDPCFVMKRELQKIPLMGQYIIRSHQIPLNRQGGPSDMKKLIKMAKTEVHAGQGRQIILFPEGTRRPVDAPPEYRNGISMIYAMLDVACVPLAHNAGLFWPNGYTPSRTGTIIVEFLPAIPSGMPRDAFQQMIEQQLETASSRLVAEGRRAQTA